MARKRKDKRALRLRGEKTGGPNKAPKPTRKVALNPALGAPYSGERPNWLKTGDLYADAVHRMYEKD